MENPKPFFSIIIPTYNRPEQLASCLEACSKLDYPRDRFEIIVVDDGEGTPTGTRVQSIKGPGATIISKDHTGPGAARNLGASVAKGDYLAFTDDDCSPAPDWLRLMAARFSRIPDQAVGGRTLNILSENIYCVSVQMILDYLFRCYNTDPDRSRFLTSSNLALPAYHFHAVGGFHRSFRTAAGEDRELIDRLSREGLRITYAPEALVYHNHPLSLHGFWEHHFKYGGGAYLYHMRSARRKNRPIRLEPLLFYINLISYPFFQRQKKRTMTLILLGILSQVAVLSGFASMKIRPFVRKNLQKVAYLKNFYRIYSKNKAHNMMDLAFRIIIKKAITTLKPKRISPTALQIEITTKCNLDCSMCDRKNRLRDHEINQSMSFEKYREIIKRHPNVLAVYLSGLGEPILNNDLLDIVEFTANNGIFPYMITNGLLLNGDLYKRLVKAGLGWLTISLDSIKYYSNIRRNGNFDILDHNITNFITLRKLGYFIPISFTITVTNQNVSEIEDIINYAINKGIDKVFIQDVRSNSKIQESDKIAESDYLVLREKIQSYRNSIGIDLMFNRFNRISKCTRPWEVAFYSVEGDNLFCCYTDKRISFGNIFHDGFPKCRHHTESLIQNLRKGEIPEICRGCTIVDTSHSLS